MNNPHSTLKRLLSITPDRYEVFYAPLYPNLNHWTEKNAAELPAEAKNDRLKIIWQSGIDALKIRRGYMLPFGSDAETCYREQEIWTYAVLTAALGKTACVTLTQPIENIIEALIPPKGYAWLKSYSSIFEIWKTYLSGKSNDKMIFDVIEEQVKNCYAQPKDITVSSENASAHPSSKASLRITVTSFDEAAQTFIPWLKQKIADGIIRCNQTDGSVYRVTEGILLMMPDLIALFQKDIHFDLPPTDKLPPVKKNLLRALSLQTDFIKNDHQQPWHTYIKEEGNHLKTFEGFLLPVACLWGEEERTWPMIDSALVPDIET